MTEISTQDLVELIERVLGPFASLQEPLEARNPAKADVQLAAFWFVQAELLKLPAFGIQMLLRDLERLDALDSLAPGGEAGAALLSIDAQRIPGHVSLALAVRLAAHTVKAQGCAILGIRNVGALGVLGCAARSLASEGAVAIISANSSAFVAPLGGTAPAIGTNPLAVAAPRAHAAPLVLDFSTSPMTLAALRQARATGGTLPASGAVDADGQRTSDPTRAAALLPEGRISSLTGLGVELITGVGVGGRLAAGLPAPERSALVIAYSPEAMGNRDAAELCAQLTQDWQGAGGHVPARFDSLPLKREQLPSRISVHSEALAALEVRAQGTD
ncbi:Ldh family oxidoreductase [Ottowia thiooxydans]|uniref:(2R)-3-sulfolactate dehydrogenase (NADP+) n=1 Tax=Ottowia thiooxydans TaxID=219182 RepID=A0ABV2Q579_9BURK